MSQYRIDDSRSEGYRNKAQSFFNRWGLDRTRPEVWSKSREQFSEDDKDLFLRADHLPRGMENDEGFYMGRQTRDLSGMDNDEYYTTAQQNEVKNAMSELGIDSTDSDVQSGRVLSHMYKKHMEHGLPSSELLDARENWDRTKSREGERSIHFKPTGDGIADAASYGNRATDDSSRHIEGLNAQANLESHEMGDAGSYHLERFQGKPGELASSDIKGLYDHYSKKLKDVG